MADCDERRRRQQLTRLTVRGDLDIPKAIPAWERQLLLPHARRALDDVLRSTDQQHPTDAQQRGTNADDDQ